MKCPKCGHERSPTDTASGDACPACGLIFEKYLKSRIAATSAAHTCREPIGEDETTQPARLRPLLFHVPDEVEAL